VALIYRSILNPEKVGLDNLSNLQPFWVKLLQDYLQWDLSKKSITAVISLLHGRCIIKLFRPYLKKLECLPLPLTPTLV
jgi:hypothetical protein